MSDRTSLYKEQSALEAELHAIYRRVEKGIRSVNREQAQQNVASVWEKYSTNHKKLLAHGANDDLYYARNSIEIVGTLVADTKKLIEEKLVQLETYVQKGLIPCDSYEDELLQRVETMSKDQERKNQEFNQQLKEIFGMMEDLKKCFIESRAVPKEKIEEDSEQKISAWLIQFRREINKLKDSLSDAKDASGIYLLEGIKNSWEKQMESIKRLYLTLTTEYLVEEDISAEMDEMETDYDAAYYELTAKICSLTEMKKTMSLEKLKIPSFNGNLHEWSGFHDMFKRFVHENTQLSQVEKLVRLKICLKGEAYNHISHLTSSEENYEGAWEMINNRFGNKRILFTKVIDRLLDQPLANSNSTSSMKGLFDVTTESIQALKAMGINMGDADPIVARVIIRKLDKEGLLLYEHSTKKSKEIQHLDDVLQFLEQQYRALEAAQQKKSNTLPRHQNKTSSYLVEHSRCLYCNGGGHKTYACRNLIEKSVNERYDWARSSKVCYVCLSHKMDKKCHSKYKCQHCGKLHNTILHFPKNEKSASMVTNSSPNVLLATAQVRVKSHHGEFLILRALIDQGSQTTSISEEAAQMLQLPRTKANTKLHGLGDTVVGVAKSKVRIEIHPRFVSKNKFSTDALILPALASAHPDKSFKYDIEKWHNFTLADPNFNKSERIDIVIGGDLFVDILDEGIHKKNKVLGQNTKLGWILSGMLNVRQPNNKLISAVTTGIERFWEIEEINDEDVPTEDDYCLKKYAETTTRGEDGKFIVEMPFKDEMALGESFKRAMARFINLEKRLQLNNKLLDEYTNFINEYIAMGHMEKVPAGVKGKYYLPHQGVMREGSLTTKFRVVFDASAKTTNGYSLNDILLVGPKLQKDIFDIITKWRYWKYVISADVEKMFRQIRVTEKDQQYQHILWRNNVNAPIEEYRLTTVTYGTASAPFLAIRTLQEIGKLCNLPTISQIINQDFYMDDLLTGANTIEECKIIQNKISSHLEEYGFHLRKWISNNDEILHSINAQVENEVLDIGEDECLKTLGLQWNPRNDAFTFKFNLSEEKVVTKRIALSYLAKIFDPMGWLTPVTVTAKLFIQHLWKIQSDWDVPLDANLTNEWLKFTQHLSSLTSIKIDRWLHQTRHSSIQLHGFADASEKAYAAVVYVKTSSNVTIVAAKSKVNPIKNKKTLPKLELCAAHLLAKLLNKILPNFKNDIPVYAWSDSTITLAWIKSSKNKDKFIRARASEISTLVPDATWGYVKSKENPADMGSRGILPEKLAQDALWWYGPHWLSKGETEWPTIQPEEIFVGVTKASQRLNYIYEITSKFSSFRKMKRVFAYILRFIKKLKGNKHLPDYLTSDELKEAEIVIIKSHQEAEMPNEIRILRNGHMIDHKNKLASLMPHLDENGIMRVGGRLEFSEVPYNMKHPIILQKSTLADLIIDEVHLSTLHGGNRLVESTIRQIYWIIGLRNAVKKCIRRCIKCLRYKKQQQHQLMGILPQHRVNISHPFTHCGIDYAGPLQIKCSNGRGQKSYKGYVAVFICMATKAVHLEAVSSLTTEAFLGALKRFFARRGKSSHMYSDNGTNFVGAANRLDKDYIAALKNNSKMAPILEEDQIKWHFIPPASPHFGGLWEAAVKSMKYHLRRIIGENKLTYEELSTLLTQIEAVLNSRPLHELDSSPEGIEVLTPGHFLIGRPMIEAPEENDEKKRISCLDRWKLLQKIKTHFWKKWKGEYLSSLQQRRKWKSKTLNLEKDQVVIIKNEETHPARWPLGRITEVHPGNDGIVRVVTLKTENGVLMRPIEKLCPLEHLPSEDTQNDNNPEIRHVNLTRKPSTKINIISIFMLMLYINILGTTSAVENSIVREMKNNTAIYLDPINQINVVSSSWNLVVYYEMEPYFDVLNKASELITISREICPRLQTFEDQCWAVLKNMQYQIEKIDTNNKLLFNKDSRSKRSSPLKFIGSFYHIIFGLMDEDDREAFENNMKNLLENQEDIKQLSKKQTSVVDSTINLLKRTTDEVNSHFSEIREKIDNISTTMNENHFIYRESIRFFMITKQMHELIEECYEVQKEAMDLLLDINHGKIHPALINPQKLQAEVMKIKDALPDKFVLPGKNTDTELKEIWHLLTGTGIFVGSKLVVDLKIPLFNRQASQFYKIIPIPIKQNGLVTIARIEAPYIVYSYELDSYHFLTQAVLNDCKKTLSNQIVCEENFPWIDASTNLCELSPINPQQKINCAYDEIDEMPFWVELRNKGNWLFKIFNNATAHIKCTNQQQTIMQLPPQGIFTLDTDCTARIDTITLMAVHRVHGESSSEFHTFLTTDVDMSKDRNIKPLGDVLISNNKDILQLKSHVENIKEETVKLRGLNFHHITGHTSLTLVTIIIIILIIMFVRRMIKLRRIAAITFGPAQNVQI